MRYARIQSSVIPHIVQVLANQLLIGLIDFALIICYIWYNQIKIFYRTNKLDRLSTSVLYWLDLQGTLDCSGIDLD